MRTAEVALLLLVAVSITFARDKRAEAEALFARANSALGLVGIAKGHLSMADVRAGGVNQPKEGTFLMAVLSDDISRWEINLPGYSEVVVRNGKRRWTRRNAGFTPLRIVRLLDALPPRLEIKAHEKVERVTEEKFGATEAKCVKLGAQSWIREVCVDATTGLPLRQNFSGLQVDYGGYYAFGDKQFPRNVRVREAGNLVAEFSLDSLSTDLPDKSLFDPLQDALFCDDLTKTKPPVPVWTPDPYYPEAVRRARVQGVVVLQTVIDEQGHASNLVVIRSLDPSLDGEAKAAVSKWRFRPAMCGDTPTSVEMKVEVAFRLY